MTTIIPERLARLDSITLDAGKHQSYYAGMCVMEAVAWLTGEDITDTPSCVSPVLQRFLIGCNDAWGDEQRQALKPYLPRMVGTAGDGQDEARSYLALDWLVRTYTPAWLDVAGLTAEAQALHNLQPIVDRHAAKAAGPAVREAQSRTAAAGEAAWDAAWAAARTAAGDAARDALQPTVTTLQTSALDLLDRMIDPSVVTAP